MWASALGGQDGPEEIKAMAAPLMAMMTQMGGMAFGSQLGQALGTLSKEVLTSTDIGLPLGPKGVAVLMPAAIEALSEGLEQSRSEIMTFLAAREAAHHRLFSGVPWLSSQLLSSVEAYAHGMKIDMSGMEELAQGLDPAALTDPAAMEKLMSQGMFEPKATPEQTVALERLETLLALVGGLAGPPSRPSAPWWAWSCGRASCARPRCFGSASPPRPGWTPATRCGTTPT